MLDRLQSGNSVASDEVDSNEEENENLEECYQIPSEPNQSVDHVKRKGYCPTAKSCWLIRTRTRRIVLGLTATLLTLSVPVLLYIAFVNNLPSVEIAETHAFLYDPVSVTIKGPSQEFEIRNNDWFTRINPSRISVSVLYAVDEDSFVSLGSGVPRLNSSLFVLPKSTASFTVDFDLSLNTYRAWREISWRCFNGARINLNYYVFMHVKLLRSKDERIQVGPLKASPVCNVAIGNGGTIHFDA